MHVEAWRFFEAFWRGGSIASSSSFELQFISISGDADVTFTSSTIASEYNSKAVAFGPKPNRATTLSFGRRMFQPRFLELCANLTLLSPSEPSMTTSWFPVIAASFDAAGTPASRPDEKGSIF